MIRSLSVMTLAASLCAAAASGQSVEMTYKPTGAHHALRFFDAQTLSLSPTRPESVKKLPKDVTAAEFGTLKLGPVEKQTSFTFALVGSDTASPKIFVDANADGDLSNDPAPDWNAQPYYRAPEGSKFNRYLGSAELQLPIADKPQPGRISFFVFDQTDTSRPAAKSKLFYYRDYGYEGEVTLGQYPYKLYLSDEKTTCDFRGNPTGPESGVKLYIDINGDKQYNRKTEGFDVRRPFKIGATVYEIKNMTAAGGSFVIVLEGQQAPKRETAPTALPSPPSAPSLPIVTKSDLLVGSPALTFKGKDLDGKEINFPGDYKGKIVLLDFWATWCSPCRDEVPNVVSTYKTYHEKGFEILGISLDKSEGEQRLRDYVKDNAMTWPQVYDGKWWSAEVAVLYRVQRIPAALLVDGDTGKILNTKETLRGPRLGTEVDAAIKKKQSAKK